MGPFDDLIPDDRDNSSGVLVENGRATAPDIFGRYPVLPPEPKTVPAEVSPSPSPANLFADLIPPNPTATPFDDLAPGQEQPAAEKPGILSALGKGTMAGARSIAEGAKQTAQLVSGATPQAPADVPADEAALAAPFDLGTMPNGQTFPKIAYHFAQGLVGGAPELGAAVVAGGGAMLATGGNPLAGLLGGAGGAGTMYVLRQIAPNFAAELKANPGDPDKAWKLALEKTSIGGVTTAAGFAAFGLNPFEGELKNIAFQAFGVQPAVSLTGKAAENVVEGKPATKGLGSEYVESALGTVGPYAAMRPFHGKPASESGEAAGEAPAGPAPEEPATPPRAPADSSRAAAEDFKAPPPDFIANAAPASEPGEKVNTPQTFKIDPTAYGVETTGMDPAHAEQAVNLATSTEESAAALRKALSDPAVVGPEIARDYEIPSFVKERTENEGKAGVSAEPAQGGDQDRIEPTLAGPAETAGGERGVGGPEGARLPPDDAAVVHEQPQAEAAGEGAEAGAGAGRDAGAAPGPEPARGGEPGQPAAQAATNPQADLATLRRSISRATGQKGVRVYGYGEGAAYDPIGGYFTVGADYPAHKEAVAAAADLAKQPTPDGWRDTEVEASLDDGSTVKTPAGAAADAITARIKRAMSVMECLGA